MHLFSCIYILYLIIISDALFIYEVNFHDIFLTFFFIHQYFGWGDFNLRFGYFRWKYLKVLTS